MYVCTGVLCTDVTWSFVCEPSNQEIERRLSIVTKFPAILAQSSVVDQRGHGVVKWTCSCGGGRGIEKVWQECRWLCGYSFTKQYRWRVKKWWWWGEKVNLLIMYIQYMVVMYVCISLLLFRVWCLHVRSSNFHLEVYGSSQWKLAIVPSLQLLRCHSVCVTFFCTSMLPGLTWFCTPLVVLMSRACLATCCL